MNQPSASSFDPYHVWLGIPVAEQPADHYRLLGVPRFESSSDVIESAADRQMAHVRSFQSGVRARESQQLLNEIASARGCLLSSTAKQAYDDSLREHSLSALNFNGASVGTSVAANGPVSIRTESPRQRQEIRWQPLVTWGGLLGIVIAGCVVVAWQLGSRKELETPVSSTDISKVNPVSKTEVPKRRPVRTIPPRIEPAVVVEVQDIEPDEPVGFSDLSAEFDALASLPQDEAAPNPQDLFAETAPVESPEIESSSDPVESDPAERLPIPTAEELVSAESFLKSSGEPLLEHGKRKRTAKELLDVAKSADVESAVRYQLFKLATDQALADQDIEVVLRSVDETALRFDVDAWQQKFELLSQLHQAAVTVSILDQMFTGCHGLVADALTAGRFDDAVRAGGLAVEAVHRPQAGHLRANAQTLFDTATRLQAQHREYETALSVLEQDANDPDANETVGRWRCCVLDEWNVGLPHLAKCDDTMLAETASFDLVGLEESAKPTKIGDAWWELANGRQPRETVAMKQRALHWYEIASAQPLNSLTGVRIEQRIKEGRLLKRPYDVGTATTKQSHAAARQTPLE